MTSDTTSTSEDFWYRKPCVFFSFFSDFIDFIYRFKVPCSVSGVCPYRLSFFFPVLRPFPDPITTLTREDFLLSLGTFPRPTFLPFSTHKTIPPTGRAGAFYKRIFSIFRRSPQALHRETYRNRETTSACTVPERGAE